ncbi:hypothetical protein AB6A40_006903 [Gnathostoma spinigerum]|uniref:Uncharacterized protein n=1 Tax=Gnathostoma spinigerum TaxID=75299 RepID=A0ABD6ESB9_9BILA
MFEYDRLALDVAEQVAHIRSSIIESSPRQIVHSIRRLSGGGFSPSESDGFDCDASSGYGSPGFGSTPMSSPAPPVMMVPAHVQKACSDHGFVDEPYNASFGPFITDLVPKKTKVFSVFLPG